MMSTNAGPFARRVLLSENVAVLTSGAENWGPVFILLVLISISRMGLLFAVTFTVTGIVPVTICPGLRLGTEIVGAATGFVGSNTVRMIRFAAFVCPA